MHYSNINIEYAYKQTNTHALHAKSLECNTVAPETFNIDFDFVYRSVCLWMDKSALIV